MSKYMIVSFPGSPLIKAFKHKVSHDRANWEEKYLTHKEADKLREEGLAVVEI